VDRSAPRGWWIPWTWLAVLFLLWFLSRWISALTWVWPIYVGLTLMTLGIPDLIKPEEATARRARNRAAVPASQRRGDALDSWLDRRTPNLIRGTGALSVLAGLAFVAGGVGAAI